MRLLALPRLCPLEQVHGVFGTHAKIMMNDLPTREVAFARNRDPQCIGCELHVSLRFLETPRPLPCNLPLEPALVGALNAWNRPVGRNLVTSSSAPRIDSDIHAL